MVNACALLHQCTTEMALVEVVHSLVKAVLMSSIQKTLPQGPCVQVDEELADDTPWHFRTGENATPHFQVIHIIWT